VCPRADFVETSLHRRIREEGRRPTIGPFEKILIARATEAEIRDRAQYGGTVSGLLAYALEKGTIKSAVLTGRGIDISPAGTIARNRAQVLQCAGSRYTASGGLAVLNRAIKHGEDRLAVVGLPCQMEALMGMSLMQPDGEKRIAPIALGSVYSVPGPWIIED
jgi:coenzyme F420 hydrogenase subunit beta